MDKNPTIEKVIQINEELCSGCGLCIEACPDEAIQIINQIADIDKNLCTGCESCLETCPKGAIVAIFNPVDLDTYKESLAVNPELNFRPQPVLQTNSAERGMKPVLGAVLTFLGNELAPRMVDIILKSIESKLKQPAANEISTSISPSSDTSRQRKGRQKQIRYRGGRLNNRKYKGRR